MVDEIDSYIEQMMPPSMSLLDQIIEISSITGLGAVHLLKEHTFYVSDLKMGSYEAIKRIRNDYIK